jgi:hypothetical protein
VDDEGVGGRAAVEAVLTQLSAGEGIEDIMARIEAGGLAESSQTLCRTAPRGKGSPGRERSPPGKGAGPSSPQGRGIKSAFRSSGHGVQLEVLGKVGVCGVLNVLNV